MGEVGDAQGSRGAYAASGECGVSGGRAKDKEQNQTSAADPASTHAAEGLTKR